MCSQAGGSWEDLADEPSSPFTGGNVMRTRCRSAFGNQSDGQKHVGTSGHGETVWLEITPDEARSSLATSSVTKDAAGCVMRTLTPLSIFSPNNKPLNCEEGESTRDTKNNDVCLPCVHVCISCACF